MSIFDRMDRLTSRACDSTFSARFHCDPMTSSPNGRPARDARREPWEAKGIVDENPQDAGVEIGKRDRRGNDLHSLVNGQTVELSVDRYRFPAAATTKQGDQIVLDDMRRFRIAETRPDGMARIVFQMVELR